MEDDFLIFEAAVRLGLWSRIRNAVWRFQYRTRRAISRRLHLAVRRMHKRMTPGVVCRTYILR